MAIAVTADEAALQGDGARLASLQQDIVAAADGDVADFDAVLSAYRLPRGDDTQRQTRSSAIEEASIAATDRPLTLVAWFVQALAVAHQVEPLVKASIVSDVLAGRDVIGGAARAAVRTADINIGQLDRLGSSAAPALHARRDALVAALEQAL